MAYYGINLTNTLGYVTNGSGETTAAFANDNDGGSKTRDGITFALAGANAGVDRSTGIDRRLAAIIYRFNSSSPATLLITLPEGAGTYNVWLAMGDAGGARTDQKVVIKDGAGGSTLLTITGTTSASNRWFDATNTERTESTWPTYAYGGGSAASGAASLTFTGTTMMVEFGNTTGSDLTALSHIGWELAGGGGGSAAGAAAHYYRQLQG